MSKLPHHLHNNLPALHVSVPQSQEAHQEPHDGSSQMGHVADVTDLPGVPGVDGPGDVTQDEERHHHHLQGSQSLPVNSVDSSVLARPLDDQSCVFSPVEEESREMSHSDAVHTAAAPYQTVHGVEAVGREGPRQDAREEDEADPPAAVDHLEDEAEADEEEEVRHNVLLVPVNQTVGQISPGLIPVIAANKQIFLSQILF